MNTIPRQAPKKPARENGSVARANQLESEESSAREIAAAVSHAILWLTTIPIDNIRISVRGGYVTLEGMLDTWLQKQTPKP